MNYLIYEALEMILLLDDVFCSAHGWTMVFFEYPTDTFEKLSANIILF